MPHTTVQVSAVDRGEGTKALYPVLAWLRDTCIPQCRPLHQLMHTHFDDYLKGAAVLCHDHGNSRVYELVIVHNHIVKRYTSHLQRTHLTVDEFNTILGVSPQ